MRAVFRKELRELRVAVIALAAVGAALALVLRRNVPDSFAVITTVALLGLPLGAYQGFLDRRACDDEYLLHRPLSFARLHAARTLAGAVSAAIVALAPLAVTLVVPYRPRIAGNWTFEAGSYAFRLNEVPAEHVLFGALVCCAMWAAARFGASARGVGAAVTGALVLPGAFALALVRAADDPIPAIVVAAAVLAFATLASSLRLPARSAERSV